MREEAKREETEHISGAEEQQITEETVLWLKRLPRTIEKGLQVFPRGKYSTLFLFLSFPLHILLLRYIVIDLGMSYALFLWSTAPLLLLFVIGILFNFVLPPMWHFKEKDLLIHPPASPLTKR